MKTTIFKVTVKSSLADVIEDKIMKMPIRNMERLEG